MMHLGSQFCRGFAGFGLFVLVNNRNKKNNKNNNKHGVCLEFELQNDLTCAGFFGLVGGGVVV